jgi:hypothetical protein
MNISSRGTTENVPMINRGLANCLRVMIACALVLAFAQVTSAQKKGKGGDACCIQVMPADIDSLTGKLQNFMGQLSDPELIAMNKMLVRAAVAAPDGPTGSNIKALFFDLRGPGILADENGDRGGGNPGRPPGGNGIVTTAGPGAIRAQDREPNRPPPPPPPDSMNTLRAALGVVVEGGIRANVGGGMVSAGPKHDDPAPPPPETINALASKLQGFGGTLTGNEKGVMNWLIDRASKSQSGPRTVTPGGAPPTLRQALGIEAFGSRAAAGGGSTWLLRFF